MKMAKIHGDLFTGGKLMVIYKKILALSSLYKTFSLLLTSIICLFASSVSFAVEIAVTLDDHPMPEGSLFSVHERVERYCRAFEKHACQTAFFCIS